MIAADSRFFAGVPLACFFTRPPFTGATFGWIVFGVLVAIHIIRTKLNGGQAPTYGNPGKEFGGALANIDVIELGESSAVQAMAFRAAFALDEATLNPHGGQVARGHPLGAAGAVLVVRLFSDLIRDPEAKCSIDDFCAALEIPKCR